jgi:hypothetical protein
VEAPEDDDMPAASGAQQANIIFVLENASLETAHVGKVSHAMQHTESPVQAMLDCTRCACTIWRLLGTLSCGCICRHISC